MHIKKKILAMSLLLTFTTTLFPMAIFIGITTIQTTTKQLYINDKKHTNNYRSYNYRNKLDINPIGLNKKMR